MIQFAKFDVITNEFGNRGCFTTDRAVFIPTHLQLTKLHAERIIHHQAADQRFANVEQQFDRFSCHHKPNSAWEHAQDASLVSARDHAGRRWGWIHAPIARSIVWLEDGCLPFKLENTTVYNGCVCQHCGIVD